MRIILILLLVAHPLLVRSQQRNQEAILLGYNIGLGGLTAGIGSMINKPKGEKLHKAFLQGFYQGCIGGFLQFSGKKLTNQIVLHDSYWYAWTSKIAHSAGASIVESAAQHRPFGRHWSMDLGLLRFDWDIGESKPFRTRFNLVTLYDILAASRYAEFDWRTSVQTGNIVFSAPDIIRGGYLEAAGVAYTRSLAYYNQYITQKQIVAHELVHIYQYREYLVFNSWLTPATKYVPPKWKNIFQNYIYVELPYVTGFYLMEGLHNYNNYYKNFYEFEAERLSSGKDVRISQ